MTNKKTWMYVSVAAILLSIATLLLPVVSYRRIQIAYRYNVFGLLQNTDFQKHVLTDYNGKLFNNIGYTGGGIIIVGLCLIGIAAIVMAFVGIKSMSKQYESNKPYTLTVCGLIGTAVPSLVLLVVFLLSKRYFVGTLHLGAYIFVTPIAMLIAFVTVRSKHRLTQEELKIKREAEAYIRPAGDLPVRYLRGNNYYGR